MPRGNPNPVRVGGAVFPPGKSGNPRGRKPGQINRRSKEAQDLARERNLEPLKVMLDGMAHFLDRVEDTENPGEKDLLMLQAIGIAKEAAPYVHPKLRMVEISGEVTDRKEVTLLLGRMTGPELLALLAKKVEHQPLQLVHSKDG